MAGVLIVAEWGAVLGARHTAASYERLVELAGLLDMPDPPPLSALTCRGASDEWVIRAGLYHDQGMCRGDRDGHWAFHCRGGV